MIDFIDKTSEQNGTPLNRSNLMAIQGFENSTIQFDTSTGTVTETFGNIGTLTVEFNADGSITEKFVGDNKTITKTTTFTTDGTIKQTLS